MEHRKHFVELSERQKRRRIVNLKDRLKKSMIEKDGSDDDEYREHISDIGDNWGSDNAGSMGISTEILKLHHSENGSPGEDTEESPHFKISVQEEESSYIESLNDVEFEEKLDRYDDDDDKRPVPELTFWDKIAMLCIKYRQTRAEVNDSLGILRESGHPELPKDARTLLGTPRKTSSVTVCGPGKYLHFGLERALLHEMKFFLEDNVFTHITMKIHIDGLPLSKSSKSQLWLVLGRTIEPQKSAVFIIGAYHGTEKPKSVHEFLADFVKEYKALHEDGFGWNGRNIKVILELVIADSPARSFVMCTKSHNGYSACPRCIVEGHYEFHKMIFPETDCDLRTDKSFADRLDEEHHMDVSPLEDISVKMVSQVPLDGMHMVDLGVIPRLLRSLISGQHPGKLSALQGKQLSELLISLRKWIPSEFARKPRGLDELLARWKATELRMFGLYLCPVALEPFLQSNYLLHFNTLHSAMRILHNPHDYLENNDCAKEQLKWLVETIPKLYGWQEMVFNVHSLIHLSDECKLHGPLESFSSYPFENFMQTIKKFILRPHDPLPQIFRRQVEMSNYEKPLSTEKKSHLSCSWEGIY